MHFNPNLQNLWLNLQCGQAFFERHYMRRQLKCLRVSMLCKVLIVFFLCSGKIYSQQCLTVENILVDACSPPSNPFWEGLNEMFTFRVGAQSINANQINITWANSIPGDVAFYGFIQNAQTATLTSAINATIISCGRVLEPPGLILPANSRVLVVTSPQLDIGVNPFSALSDTIYILYHKHPGPTFSQPFGTTIAPGHFINYNTNPAISIIQNFRIRVNGTSCDVSVSYNQRQLVTQAGTTGAQDGASIRLDNAGNLTYYNNGCSAPVEPISAEWNPPGPICDNDTPIDLSALVTGTPGGVFSGSGVTGNQFNPAGLSGQVQITYTVKPGSCAKTQTKAITVTKSQSAEWNAPGSVCPGAVIDLNTLLSGGVSGGTWTGNGVTGNTLNTSGLSGQISVTYKVGSGACASEVTRNIQITANPDPAWNPPAPICSSATPINLNTLVTGTPGGTWSGQGVSNGFFNPNGLNGAVVIKYKVGSGSCADSLSKPINVLSGAGTQASFTVEPSSGTAPLNVTIIPTPADPSATCVWTINGEEIDEPGTNPVKFSEKGAYIIKRACETAEGCRGEFSQTINVSGEEFEIYIPNTFTPNEDGVNEIFSVKGIGIDKIKIWIFNRWGELLYSWDCLDDCGWDGFYKGKRVPNGVYVYRLEALGLNGTKTFRSGKVCVIH